MWSFIPLHLPDFSTVVFEELQKLRDEDIEGSRTVIVQILCCVLTNFL